CGSGRSYLCLHEPALPGDFTLSLHDALPIFSKQFERAYRKRGIEYSLGVRFQSVTQDENGVVVTLENGKTIEAELLLVLPFSSVDRKSTRLNSSHVKSSYAVFCLKKTTSRDG